jgi:hypothetical protein
MKKTNRIARKLAWKGIRLAFQGSDFKGFPASYLNAWGLCNAVNRMEVSGLISVKTASQMLKDICSQKPRYWERDAYYWPIPDKEARIKAITKILRERCR